MSGKRSKKLRAAFEKNFGFNIIQRGSSAYKYHWRRFKKELKKGR